MERRIALLLVLLVVHGVVIEVRGGNLMRSRDDRCQCMNWRSCRGWINDNVPCPQTYVDVCCVNPSLTEPTPDEERGDAGDKFVYKKILLTVVQ